MSPPVGPTSAGDAPDRDDSADQGAGDTAAALVATGRRRLAVVAVVVFAEALALLAFAGFLVIGLFTEEADDARNAVIEAVSFGVLGVLLIGLAYVTFRARRWSRGPVVTTQLLALLGPGIPLLQGDLWYARWIGVPLVAGSAVAIVLMLTPPVVAALYDDD
jgi:hypothetical protein